jgi:GAF domain-containing protein
MSLEQLLGQAVSVVGADAGYLQLLDSTGALVMVAARNMPPEALTTARVIKPDAPYLCNQVLRSRQPLLVDDAETDPRAAAGREQMRRLGMRSCRLTPLVGEDGGMLGVLAVIRSRAVQAAEWEGELLRVQGREAGRRVEWLLRG